MTDLDRRFHETWLGMLQPIDGLVLSVPVLVDAQCMERQPPSTQDSLRELCPPRRRSDALEEGFTLGDLAYFLQRFLGYAPEHLARGDALPEALSLYVPEGRQTLRPTLALRKLDAPAPAESAESTPASRAGSAFEMLLWQLPTGLPLDKPETVTGPWDYPPSAKFDRLLRHTRVPVGLLTNDEVLRLVYAPHGESSGSLTFRLDELVSVGGRPLLDAFVMLLGANRFYGVEPARTLPALLAESRKRQANVTNELAGQVFEALQLLLAGFQSAAQRDGAALLEDALSREGDHLYRGLLTVLLRLVFVLYAEDRGLLPVEHPLYAQHYSVLALFEQLQRDRGAWPDSMARRFGAWGRLVALFRAVYLGVSHGDFHMPARRGELFDPHRFAFLEGWGPAGSAPLTDPVAQAAVRVPTLDDGTVLAVLQKLLLFEGQRLSYRALDVEQLGSVYEGLMGYHVVRLPHDAVCTRPERVWVTAEELLAVPPAQRAKWLKETLGWPAAQADKCAKEVDLTPPPPLSREGEGGVGQRAASLGASKSEAPTLGQRPASPAASKSEAPTPPSPSRERGGGGVRSMALSLLARYAAGRRGGDPGLSLGRAGQLVLQPGSERRRTSSHYTPRSLSAPIVRRTLEPLLAVLGEAPASESLLALKVCDPAMGSGAFLVEACRFLADHVVAAWTREGSLEALQHEHGDPLLHARRLVAQRCLYGVDKNAQAVELARLSLWLVTLARELPFTFVDHALRHGDSLVGLDFAQLESFHWKPGAQQELFGKEIRAALEEALAPRQRLLSLAGSPRPEDQAEKARLLWDAEDAMSRVRLVADVLVGAFFAHEKDKDREKERARRLQRVSAWLQGDDSAGDELRALQRQLRERLPAFHWCIEFPEVFYGERPDPLDGMRVNGAAMMDAFVGNPPFAGKNGIIEAGGESYLPWLQAVREGVHGNADLSAHFFRRAAELIGEHGTLGLIATNTIAQGDTRSTGLQWLVKHGFVIYDATDSLPWPGDAAVTVSVVHLAVGAAAQRLTRSLDGNRVSAISSMLREGEERADAAVLSANAKSSFQGSIVLGMGFTLTPEERDALVKKSPSNEARIFPYLGGEEVNTSPTQSFHRYVINFGQLTLEEAEQWPDLLAIVREKVKPERDQNKRDVRREYWWRFGEVAPALYFAIAPFGRCLVNSQVSKHLVFAFQPTNRVFGHTLYAFALAGFSPFAVLQSRIHERWARLLSSSMKTDLRYSVSDCFETFPFPQPDPRTVIPALETLGEALYTARASYMVDEQVGLTVTYNRLKDPGCTEARIVALRAQHEALDRAVLEAYGWQDLCALVPPFCLATEEDRRALERFESAVLDRLFALNAQRAEEEKRAAAASEPPAKSKPAKPAGAKKPRGKKGPAGQGDLGLEGEE